jgi:plastocyanin
MNVAFWMVTAAVSAARNGDTGITALVVPAALTAGAVAGVVAAAGALLTRGRAAGRPGLAWAAGMLVFAGLAVTGLAGAGGRGAAEVPDVVVTAADVAFSSTELRAPAGEVTVRMDNTDLFWHTFTVDELGVDLQVPVGGARSVTFDAPPGEYPFYCKIPGHPQAGMRGTLILE